MLGPFTLLHSVLAAYPALLDALKLALLGIFLDRTRVVVQGLWTAAVRGFQLSVRVNDSDDAYDWLHHYLSKHCMDPSPTPSLTPWAMGDSILQILQEEIWPMGRVPPRDVHLSVLRKRYYWEDDQGDEVEQGKVDTHMAPSLGMKHYLQFQGYTICFTRCETQVEWGYKMDWITMSAMFAPHSLFTDLVNAAHREFLLQDHGKLRIFTPRREGSGWKKSGTKPHRPWDSVILPGSIKDDILKDTREFLEEGPFYRKRGLPYRRGYLLYGSPGAGKSSLIAALAADLKLDVYIVNLSAKTLDDDILSKLLHDVPSRSILLMEDIDCALNDREAKDDSDDEDVDKKKKSKQPTKKAAGGVTLSGLLNALDGVASSEGRLLFCTTNHVDQIDSALSRPGRCDIWVEFTHATKSQILELFVHFYHPGSAYLLSGNDLSITSSRTLSSVNSRPQACSPASPTLNGTLVDDEKFGQKTPSNALLSSPVIIDSRAWLSSPDSLRFAEMLERLDDMAQTNILELAMRFANIVPDFAVSVSAIQGYLMRYKRRPEYAVDGAKEWVKAGFPQGPGAKAKTESEHQREVTPPQDNGDAKLEVAIDTTQSTVASPTTEAKSPAKSFGSWVKTSMKKEKA